MFRQETSTISLTARKSKSFGFCQNFSPEVLSSAEHVEYLPGWSSFSFEVFADAKFADSTPLVDSFSENLDVFR